ncbi:uncharacterized protein LOC113389103 [Ctenocephalides felis]|uniref:uncharacterized protein LOC113389103 n=1 Tax=Ctenocephalides felis TaxID=7515 RepID=UPI000E6E1F89|nr:uncharacterized protein LOC113389103 [Ctenocephalides felis]
MSATKRSRRPPKRFVELNDDPPKCSTKPKPDKDLVLKILPLEYTPLKTMYFNILNAGSQNEEVLANSDNITKMSEGSKTVETITIVDINEIKNRGSRKRTLKTNTNDGTKVPTPRNKSPTEKIRPKAVKTRIITPSESNYKSDTNLKSPITQNTGPIKIANVRTITTDDIQSMYKKGSDITKSVTITPVVSSTQNTNKTSSITTPNRKLLTTKDSPVTAIVLKTKPIIRPVCSEKLGLKPLNITEPIVIDDDEIVSKDKPVSDKNGTENKESNKQPQSIHLGQSVITIDENGSVRVEISETNVQNDKPGATVNNSSKVTNDSSSKVTNDSISKVTNESSSKVTNDSSSKVTNDSSSDKVSKKLDENESIVIDDEDDEPIIQNKDANKDKPTSESIISPVKRIKGVIKKGNRRFIITGRREPIKLDKGGLVNRMIAKIKPVLQKEPEVQPVVTDLSAKYDKRFFSSYVNLKMINFNQYDKISDQTYKLKREKRVNFASDTLVVPRTPKRKLDVDETVSPKRRKQDPPQLEDVIEPEAHVIEPVTNPLIPDSTSKLYGLILEKQQNNDFTDPFEAPRKNFPFESVAYRISKMKNGIKMPSHQWCCSLRHNIVTAKPSTNRAIGSFQLGGRETIMYYDESDIIKYVSTFSEIIKMSSFSFKRYKLVYANESVSSEVDRKVTIFKNGDYTISMDGISIRLCAAPLKVRDVKDIEILLDIIDHINLKHDLIIA